MYEQHWRYMQRIIELGDGPRVYARYNTNLSRIDYKKINLYRDILAHVKDFQVCASLDGTGAVGEYIRTGLVYEKWLDHFEQGLEDSRNDRSFRIDFTLTLPGLKTVAGIQALADRLKVDILAKVVFSFTPDIILSPLALPRELLNREIDRLLPLTRGALAAVLTQLKLRPTFEEQWPDTYRQALARGKVRVLELERIRNDSLTLRDILAEDEEMARWYDAIG
jgi:hypothetical protein